jgi:pyridoxine kinase
LTGYFAEAGQVRVAADAVRQMKARNGDVIYLCDPVIGDDHTGIYVAEDIACAIRDELLPLADVIAPNRFELAWLSGREVDELRGTLEAARALPCGQVLATSLPGKAGGVTTALVADDGVCSVTTHKRELVPHGTGDLLAGLFLADLIAQGDSAEALRLAVAQLEAVLNASAGSDRLDLVRGLENVRDVAPLPLDAP